MDPSFSLDHKWWLEFQPDVNIQNFFIFEHMDGKKSDATEENLQSNGTICLALKATHNRCEQGKLSSPFPLCSNLELTKCSNVQTCERNKITMPQPFEVYDDDSAVEVVEEIAGRNIHKASVVDTCWEEILGKNKLADGTGLERSLDYYLHCTNTKSYNKGGITWRQADQRELASIVAIKSAEHLQNCDLPPPQSVWLGCRFLESSGKYEEADTSMPKDRDDKTSAGRSMGLEEKALISLQPSGHSSLPSLVSEANESLAVQTVPSDHLQEKMPRCNDRIPCSDGNTETTENDNIKLNILEALRRSQTRAREAEKTAELVILENEKLLSLLIREASHRNFYKQWLAVLQIENSKLRWQVKILQSKDQGRKTCNSREVLKRKKVVTKQDQCCVVNYQGRHCKKIKKSKPKRNGSWAFAVALGLSLASVGLILGWSMGWIFPSL
ncbi:hypothetical protein SUGI_0804340 [Cryptomeria japonica]|uniref:uncharacterized protein LOC131062448 n=1 Tax=Cryptomeria japonica TaxID=3369 RepID=UPI002414BBF6|nr:uncharacterized protein LOC131062448 [Cryptomeria japonica]GLJ39388.1 hypothetical protein SUGI_0804340 [Cryptomeria japonica]